jgi:hypothetical protein
MEKYPSTSTIFYPMCQIIFQKKFVHVHLLIAHIHMLTKEHPYMHSAIVQAFVSLQWCQRLFGTCRKSNNSFML